MQDLLNLAVILAIALLLGWACRRVHLPTLIGEIGAGLILGPTLLGRLVDGHFARAWLPLSYGLPTSFNVVIGAASTILLFYYGTTIWTRQLPGRRAIVSFVAWSVTVPAFFGVIIGISALLPSPISRSSTAAIMAVLFAISALPVIVRVFHDLDLHRSHFGTTIIAVASITDILCWIMLSLFMGYFAPNIARQSLWNFFIFCGVLLLGFLALRRVFAWFEKRSQQRVVDDAKVLGIVTIAILGGGWLAHRVGVHYAMVAFLVGVTVAQFVHLTPGTAVGIRRLALWVCGPIFFSSVGLRTDYAANFQLRTVILVIGVAYLTKMIAGWWGARSIGWPPRLRVVAGIALSARGAMDIIIATIALESALISPAVFEAFVVMAILTSLTTYLIRPILRSQPE